MAFINFVLGTNYTWDWDALVQRKVKIDGFLFYNGSVNMVFFFREYCGDGYMKKRFFESAHMGSMWREIARFLFGNGLPCEYLLFFYFIDYEDTLLAIVKTDSIWKKMGSSSSLTFIFMMNHRWDSNASERKLMNLNKKKKKK